MISRRQNHITPMHENPHFLADPTHLIRKRWKANAILNCLLGVFSYDYNCEFSEICNQI
jgi:hypothetical protein